LSSDNTKRLLMYYNVMTMTVMVILNCSLLWRRSKTIATIRAKYSGQRGMRTRQAQRARAHTTFGISTWNLSEHDSMVARYSTHLSYDNSTSQQDNLSHVTSYENRRVQHFSSSKRTDMYTGASQMTTATSRHLVFMSSLLKRPSKNTAKKT
jgi:hypothetical protein